MRSPYPITNPKNIENPITKIFLEELRSTPWRFDNPTPATVPKSIKKIPPMTLNNYED